MPVLSFQQDQSLLNEKQFCFRLWSQDCSINFYMKRQKHSRKTDKKTDTIIIKMKKVIATNQNMDINTKSRPNLLKKMMEKTIGTKMVDKVKSKNSKSNDENQICRNLLQGKCDNQACDNKKIENKLQVIHENTKITNCKVASTFVKQQKCSNENKGLKEVKDIQKALKEVKPIKLQTNKPKASLTKSRIQKQKTETKQKFEEEPKPIETLEKQEKKSQVKRMQDQMEAITQKVLNQITESKDRESENLVVKGHSITRSNKKLIEKKHFQDQRNSRISQKSKDLTKSQCKQVLQSGKNKLTQDCKKKQQQCKQTHKSVKKVEPKKLEQQKKIEGQKKVMPVKLNSKLNEKCDNKQIEAQKDQKALENKSFIHSRPTKNLKKTDIMSKSAVMPIPKSERHRRSNAGLPVIKQESIEQEKWH